eukprot:Nk52_evm98s217 gene=Nk52_evmTU98s217
MTTEETTGEVETTPIISTSQVTKMESEKPTDTAPPIATITAQPSSSPKKEDAHAPAPAAVSSPKKMETEGGEAKGLYDKPLIQSGSRKRKAVERLEVAAPVVEKKKLEIADGNGMAIRDIPNICFQLGKIKGEELKPLHRLLFGNPGKAKEVKANIRQFKGFIFKDDAEKEKKKEILGRFTTDGLRDLSTVLDIPRSGDKNGLIERIMSFLCKPYIANDSLLSEKAAKKAKKKANKAKKRKSTGSSAKKKSPAKKSPSKSNFKSKEAVSDESMSEAAPEEDEEEESSDDDAPLVKKPKGPTDTDIVEAVNEILRTANLEELSKKKVRQSVAGKFPTLDVGTKKDLISRTIDTFLEKQGV